MIGSVRTIAKRELLSLFVSPIAYIVLFCFLLVNGAMFRFHVGLYDGEMGPVLMSMFGGPAFWFLWLLIPPLIAMRSFAEERRSGTFELLVTSGVGDLSIVLGKFIACWIFLGVLWAGLLPLLLLAEAFGQLDWGIVASTYCGLAISSALLASIGLLASSITQNQLIAAVLATVVNLGLILSNFLRALFPPSAIELRFFEYVSPPYHFARDFSQGVVDLSTLVLYASLTAWTLFATVKVLERRRWA